ncbi:hypothetical protein IWQ60_004576 [Tieghemiomyces parasiticus]|uniref:Prefoldin subunit 5 n=1 Tax=Tieghemiomyces parasiticus TaxID=78921 RepID=A0A9W7ZS90_9FUNG|nr:hypothetical protein IWQ60_010172 [Tieghemiomyces parasiticus]KAJ1925415.1 hypothetical protein IWQ60_004576 [Tieghemiomyces parasiticus]
MADISAQIAKYEAFVTDQLQPDLATVLADRDAVYERIAEYLKLRNNIEILDRQQLTSLKTQVDLGSNFYVQAHVPDTTYVYVNVGQGFHLQMTHAEALEYIARKDTQLQGQADKLSQKANHIKAQIRTVYLALAEIMQLGAGKP